MMKFIEPDPKKKPIKMQFNKKTTQGLGFSDSLFLQPAQSGALPFPAFEDQKTAPSPPPHVAAACAEAIAPWGP